MINNATFDAVYPLAEMLAAKGILIKPMESTPRGN